ncbi:MAG: UDP-glucose 4-epimerase GalE [Aerococcus sp.]|nr:UDP-glucose 4-epimerase GalE [Aerococcus sp.]
MSILVTGGAGYIGSHTTIELLNAGYDVVIVDDLSNSQVEVLDRVEQISGKQPKFYEINILDHDKLREVFQKETIDAVIHFAAFKAVGESVEKPLEYYKNNTGGLLAVMEVMREFDCKTLIFSSSATVYGSDNQPPLREDLPTGQATNPYGYTKVFGEQILRDMVVSDSNWSVVLLRYFNPIGAHESGLIGENPNGIPNNLMPYITQVAIGKRDHLSVFGDDYDTPDGTGVRDYIHVVDLARGHVDAVKYALAHTESEAINLGTGEGYSVLDLVHTFEEVNNITIPYEIVERRAGDVDANFADPTKAKKLLGWEAKRDLKDMCRDAWNWQSHNPNGYEA